MTLISDELLSGFSALRRAEHGIPCGVDGFDPAPQLVARKQRPGLGAASSVTRSVIMPPASRLVKYSALVRSFTIQMKANVPSSCEECRGGPALLFFT